MTGELQPRHRMHLWLIGLIILLAALTLVEGAIIFSMKRPAEGSRPCLLSKILPSPWLTPAGPALHHPSPHAQDGRIMLWESAQDLETIHDKINRLFSTFSTPGIPPHPAWPGHSGLRAHAMPAMDDMTQLQQEINQIFEGAFNDMDALSLPGRLEQGWNQSGVSSSLHMDDQGSNIVVQMTLPDLDPSAIAISLQGRLLTIAVNPPADEQVRRTGHSLSAASRKERWETKVMLSSPVDAAAAQANYKDGLLRVIIPKSVEQESLARSIKVI